MEFPRTSREAHINEQLAARYINHTLNLEPDGEIINLDYDPTKLYTILQRANEDQLDETFHAEIIKVLQSYVTLRKRIFKIARTPNSIANNEHFLKIGRIFHKYHITDQIHNERHLTKAITIPRLMLLFPHLLAKVVTVDLNVESVIPHAVLQETGLANISPACFWKSSFCLLPKFKTDIDDTERHKMIIKAMLLAQFEQHEIIHEDNQFRARKSPVERMQAVLMNCKVIYNSNHLLGGIRWASYNFFLLKDPFNGVKFEYERAAEVFDTKFAELNPVLEHVFKLRDGTGIEQGTNVNEILRLMGNVKL